MRHILIILAWLPIVKLSQKDPTHRSSALSSRHLETFWWVNPLKKSGCNFFSIGIPYEETCPGKGLVRVRGRSDDGQMVRWGSGEGQWNVRWTSNLNLSLTLVDVKLVAVTKLVTTYETGLTIHDQRRYNKDPTTEPGTLTTYTSCLAQLRLPSVLFLFTKTLISLSPNSNSQLSLNWQAQVQVPVQTPSPKSKKGKRFRAVSKNS